MQLYLFVQGILGYLLSLLYETVAGNWHSHKIKSWIFVVVCLGMGTWGAILDQTLQLTPLSWGDPESIISSLGTILHWGGVILAAGLTSFKFFIHKKS